MARVRITCSIQQGSIGYNKIKQLESVIASTYQAHFGTHYQCAFFWIDLPYQQAFLAGKQSSASTAQVPVPNNTPNDIRHPFMSEVCAKWQHITGCSKDEIILVSPDMDHFDQFHLAMQRRFAPDTAKKAQLKMIAKFFLGRIKKGYLNTSVNL